MINQIITSTILIIAILLISVVLEKRIHPCIKYALWLVVAFKLLVPLPSFENEMSILNVVNQIDTNAVQYRFINNQDNKVIDQRSVISEGNIDEMVTEGVMHMELTDMFLIIWILGMMVCGGIFLWSNLRFRRYVSLNRKYVKAYRKKLAVYEVEGIATPCLFGALAPAIYLKKECDLSEEEMGYILEHEYTHFRHRDNIWAMVRCICVVVYWFNPFVWLAARKSMEDSELACDAGTLKQLQGEEHIPYGKTLIAVAQNMTSKRNTMQILRCSTGATGGMREMKKRMQMIVKRPQTKLLTVICVVVLCCCMVGCTFGGAVGTTEAIPSEKEELQNREEQAAKERAEAEKEAAKAAKAELESAKKQAEEQEALKQQEIETDAYELLDEETDFTYQQVALYASPQEDKVCLSIAPAGVRDFLNCYYIPEGEYQEQLLSFVKGLEDEWQANTNGGKGRKEIGCRICYNGQEYMMFEDGYFYGIRFDEENGDQELLVRNQEFYDSIQQLLLEELDYAPVDITQIKDIQSATLEICTVRTNDQYYSQTITDEAVLKQFEEWFSNAEYIYGGVGCGNEDSCLSLTLASGEVIKLAVACDSCPNFGVNGVYYDYRPADDWQNTEFFSCFDEIPWEF